jgi:anti-sigma regulatory factor (Ser/Thr protein kinase)
MPGRAYRPSPHTEDGALTPAVSKSFLPDEASPRSARLWAREALSLRADVDVDAVALLVSELATNAVVHAKTPFTVVVRTTDASVRIEVEDGSDDPPERTSRGMGLRVTDDVASSWGWHPVPDGKAVWFEVVGEP